MDKEKLKAYGVDYENAVKRFAGNEALYEKFLKKLTTEAFACSMSSARELTRQRVRHLPSQF